MSLQRVFESARRLGVPIIITDPAGREPLVVLPLERFETMSGIEGARLASAGEPHREAMPRAEAAVQSPEWQKTHVEPPSIQLESLADKKVEENAENPLEERFYFEPAEDQ